MKQAAIVIGLLVAGAVGWTLFGDQIIVQAHKTLNDIHSGIAGAAQDITDSIKPSK